MVKERRKEGRTKEERKKEQEGRKKKEGRKEDRNEGIKNKSKSNVLLRI